MPIERSRAVRPLVSETIVHASRLPTAAALAAALFAIGATGVASIGCGTSRTEASSIGAADHDRGRVLASNEATAHEGDGDKKPTTDTTVETKPMPSTTAIAGGGVAPPVTTTVPHPVPVPHGGKVAPIKPVAVPPPMPGGKAPTVAMPPSTLSATGATTTPPCANPGVEATY